MSSDLQGKRIIVTREAGQAKIFAEKIRAAGGIPIEVPLLQISCKKPENQQEIFKNINTYHWVIFTSVNGVNCFFRQLIESGYVFPQQTKVAVVGVKTEKALQQQGVTADLVPETYDAETLASIFLPKYENNERILLVRGNRSLDVLPKRFAEKGIGFDKIEVYETTRNDNVKERLTSILENQTYDYITFTSPSTINAFIEFHGKPVDTTCVCIGTTTRNAAESAGFKTILTAEIFTIEGMLDVISKDK